MSDRVASRRSRMLAPCLRTFAFVSLTLACSDPPAPAPPPRAAPEPVSPVVSPRRIGTEGGFDLVATPDGALLAWGPPATEGGGVRVAALDARGGLEGAERDVAAGSHVAPRAAEEAPAQVLELVAASAGSTLAVAWVAANVPSHLAEVTVSRAGVEGFGPAFSLGDTATVTMTTSPRGRLAAQLSDEAVLMRLRLPTRACAGGAACEGTRRVRIDPSARRSALEGPSDEAVPEPCEPFLVGAVWSVGTYFHAFCHVDDGGPSAMIWALDPEPMLAAQADPLPGCEPLGMAPTASGAALVARCPDGLGVAWVDSAGRLEGVARPAHREVVCTAGRPSLRVIGGDGTSLEVPLTGAASRLEGLLDESIAGPRARAAWTGSALLVAEPGHGEVALERWECPAFPGALRRTDR